MGEWVECLVPETVSSFFYDRTTTKIRFLVLTAVSTKSNDNGKTL
jgi:hypothetical protein